MATRALDHVRFFIVGTKVDLMSDGKTGSWIEAEKKLKIIEADMRSVVLRCCGESALKNTNVLFATAMGTHPQYKRLRAELKELLLSKCSSIFEGDASHLKTLRFPELYRDFRRDVKKLSLLHSGLPILELESITGPEYGLLAGSHTNPQSLQALHVLHDVGDIIFCNVSDGQGGSKACLCWQPQVVASVIAEFVDPQGGLPVHRGCASQENLMAVLEQFLQKNAEKKMTMQGASHQDRSAQTSRENATTLFKFLLALRVIIELPVPFEASLSADPSHQRSLRFMVPSALKGRPSFWRDVFEFEQFQFSFVRGVRFVCMDAMITVASFIRTMTHLCSDPTHMWGCAFSFELGNCGHIFVRLAESRDFVDVVVLGREQSQLSGECVDNALLQITTLLRCSMDNALPLCPHCCASDMFARSGAVHAFYREQLVSTTAASKQPHDIAASTLLVPALDGSVAVDASDNSITQHAVARSFSSSGVDYASMVSCSRYHEVSKSGVLMGQRVGSIGIASMPVSYPEGPLADRNALPWISVSSTGLADMGSGGVEVLPNSFFSLTKQLKEGDVISASSLAAIDVAIRSGAKTCRVKQIGAEFDMDVRLEYSLGDQIGGKEIDVILCCSSSVEIKSADASSGTVTTKSAHVLRCGDEVMLSVAFDSNGSKVEGVRCHVTCVISDIELVLQRMQPPKSSSAAEILLPLAADVCIMPIRKSFAPFDNVLVVYKKAYTYTTQCAHQLSCGNEVVLFVPLGSDGSKMEAVRCRVINVVSDVKLLLQHIRPPTYPTAAEILLVMAADICIMPAHRVMKSIAPSIVYTEVSSCKPMFDLFPGVSNTLHIARLVPNDCSRSAEAACWRDVEDNWAIMLGTEFQNYEITGMTIFRCEERERLFLNEVKHLESIALHRPVSDFGLGDSEQAKLQQQVLGHFNDFSQKFSVLPNQENKDVNLSVAWWGKWPAVYHGAAQNGFWNLPSHLKIDPGYFGEGFYLTRCPRYSDYYINGFSLSKQKDAKGSILMCYAALGRPYPVTQDPFPPPLYTIGPPAASSLCGKACGAACGGIESHDSHYVTVKMHPYAHQYFPCPLRQQPDFDEIVVFKPERILPAAYVVFERRYYQLCCTCAALTFNN